ncbi:MAG: F0F1 ATP synthase subunit B [Gemmatimonadales bacterium]|nr:F0F1 ATP synthase subunit B [Gemmatimonadales bacterium]
MTRSIFRRHASTFAATLAALSLLALPAAAQEAEHEAASGPLSVEGGLMVWTIIVFLLLLFILRKYAWPAVLSAVEAREKALEDQMAEAQRNRAESARLLEEHKRLVADARTQAHQALLDARTAAENERAAAMERTRQEQDELLERARREIRDERERAIADLRREAVDLSLAAAGKLIGERLDSDADRTLVMNYLGTLDAAR